MDLIRNHVLYSNPQNTSNQQNYNNNFIISNKNKNITFNSNNSKYN